MKKKQETTPVTVKSFDEKAAGGTVKPDEKTAPAPITRDGTPDLCVAISGWYYNH